MFRMAPDDGPRGEPPAPLAELELTDAEAERARAAGFRVAIVLHTADGGWSSQQVDGIAATMRDYGGEVVDVVVCGFEGARQAVLLRDLIRRRPDAIVGIPVDATATADAFQDVVRAGIVLVLMDNKPHGLESGRDYATLVSADNRGNGAIAAEALAPYVGPGGTAGVIGFDADFFATREREAGFGEWFAANRPDVEIKRTGFPDPGQAGPVAEQFLAENPVVEALFVVWDAPAMDAVRAARRLGRDAAITTVDLGEEAAAELAAGGLIKGLAAQQPYDHGVAEALAAIGALLGKRVPSWVIVPALPVTRENVLVAFERVWHAEGSAALRAAAAAGGARFGNR